ncbi:acyl-CoA synthetase [Corynebacterium halotolerans YIM 70093 = DSM 44683]|uniref:Acyl-CoA synthetase n=1 Tax=Corynebacterium halotolerans YIM 70093 = DSM 44683 TaxID=1121362 RepID=M1NYR9_9CORY|nr:acyl-CoA synthetase [Corynebacterium halotolerans YIM 70093 = DSM 44683]
MRGDGHRGPHDAGAVAQLGRDDRGVDGQVRDPALVVTGDAAAHDEGGGGEESLVLGEHLRNPLGPLLEAELLAVLRGRRGQPLRLLAVDNEVSELGVREQPALGEEGGADAGAEGEEDDRTLGGGGLAEGDLGQAGRVRVVEDTDLPVLAQVPVEQLVDIGADPGGVDIRRGQRHLLPDDRRQCDADRAVPLLLPEDLRDDLRDRVRGRRLRRRDLGALADELPVVEVHARPLDAGAADVDAEADIGHGGQCTKEHTRARDEWHGHNGWYGLHRAALHRRARFRRSARHRRRRRPPRRWAGERQAQ